MSGSVSSSRTGWASNRAWYQGTLTERSRTVSATWVSGGKSGIWLVLPSSVVTAEYGDGPSGRPWPRRHEPLPEHQTSANLRQEASIWALMVAWSLFGWGRAARRNWRSFTAPQPKTNASWVADGVVAGNRRQPGGRTARISTANRPAGAS